MPEVLHAPSEEVTFPCLEFKTSFLKLLKYLLQVMEMILQGFSYHQDVVHVGNTLVSDEFLQDGSHEALKRCRND